MDWRAEAAIVAECFKNGFCWRRSDVWKNVECYDYWSMHEGVLWRGCIPYATRDRETGALTHADPSRRP